MKTLLVASLLAAAVLAVAPSARAQEYGPSTGALMTTAGWMLLGGPIELTFDVTDVVLAASCTSTPGWYSVLEAVFGFGELAQITYMVTTLPFRSLDDATAAAGILSPFVAFGIAHVVHALWPLLFHEALPRGTDIGVHAGPQAALVQATFAI